MLVAILLSLALCPVAAWLGRRPARWARWLSLWPLLLTLWFGAKFAAALDGAPYTEHFEWVPQLGLALSFRLDGLSGLFAVMITGIGTGVITYGAHYFEGHPYSGRFQATLFAFMAAMLGVVLTDNGPALFVFWELTGFTSYLLIGFDHDQVSARRAALQALLVTGGGGLALLAGVVLLGQATGSSSLLSENLVDHPHYTAIALCFLLAAFTKSAQFPFHFWLPNAMAAPTPVSAYLHSATMVKAGVYLVARMTPTLGSTALWTTLIAAIAGVTMLGGAVRAMRETDLKKILAYTTISALGTMLFLLGLGTPACITAGLVYLAAHACYKGALFLVTGIIDHETGTRDVRQLSGLRIALPFTAVAGGIAAVSMAGLPPALGFLSKELAYAGVLDQPLAPLGLTILLVISSALLGAAGLVVGVVPFLGRPGSKRPAHEAAAGLFVVPLLLAALGLVGLVAPWGSRLVASAASAVAGRAVSADLALFHGFELPLLLSGVTIVLMLAVVLTRARWRREGEATGFGPERLYHAALNALDWVSSRIAPPLQDASLPAYVLVFIVSTTVLTGTALFVAPDRAEAYTLLVPRVYEVLIIVLVVMAAITATRARRTMTAVLSLGTAGYGVALMFALYGAPDLAMTQFAVETLTAVIFVYVFWQFPQVVEKSSRRVRVRDGVIALAAGTLVAALTFNAAVNPTSSRLRDFYAEAAPSLAHGRNVVNVILVDFRALDTLGEITVLMTAAVGVVALMRIAREEKAAR